MTAAARTSRRSAPAPAVDDLDLLRRRLRALGRDGHAEIPIQPEPHAVAWVVATMLADIEGLPWPAKSPDVVAAMARATGSVVTEPDGTRVIWLGWGSWVDAARENAERAAAVDRSATVDVLRQLAAEIAPVPPVPRAEAAQDAPRGAPMIARTDDLLDGLAAEVERDAADAVYVVATVDDADALTACAFDATPAADAQDVAYRAAEAARRGAPVVLVGDVGAAVRDAIAGAAPTVTLRWLAEPRSPALALGWPGAGIAAGWSLAEAQQRRRTWLAVAAGAVIDTAGRDDEHEPYPIDALPSVLRDYVQAGAEAQGVPVDYWAAPLLGVVAGCIGATRVVRITSTWCEPCVVWCAVVAPSGAGKSPPLRALLAPVRDHDYRLHLRTVALQQQHEAEHAAWQDASRDDRGPEPQPPPLLASIVGDVTTEALAVRLADNPRGLLLAVDELAGWLRSHNRYRGGGDEQTWLSIHNADALKVDRKAASGGPSRVYVRHAAVSTVGTIQPGIARRYLASDEHVASGTAARVLLAAPPVVPARLLDRDVPEHVQAAYARCCASLLDLTLDDEGEPVPATLAPAALERFRSWHDRNGDACAAAGRAGDEAIAAALSKLRGYAPRIALLFALARATEDGAASLLRVVDDQAMAAACRVVDWHEGQARRLYSRWTDDAAEARAERQAGTLSDLAERLAGLLRHGELSREDMRTATGRNVSAVSIGAALAILRGAGRADVRRIGGASGGRPREVWSLRQGGAA